MSSAAFAYRRHTPHRYSAGHASAESMSSTLSRCRPQPLGNPSARPGYQCCFMFFGRYSVRFAESGLSDHSRYGNAQQPVSPVDSRRKHRRSMRVQTEQRRASAAAMVVNAIRSRASLHAACSVAQPLFGNRCATRPPSGMLHRSRNHSTSTLRLTNPPPVRVPPVGRLRAVSHPSARLRRTRGTPGRSGRSGRDRRCPRLGRERRSPCRGRTCGSNP